MPRPYIKPLYCQSHTIKHDTSSNFFACEDSVIYIEKFNNNAVEYAIIMKKF